MSCVSFKQYAVEKGAFFCRRSTSVLVAPRIYGLLNISHKEHYKLQAFTWEKSRCPWGPAGSLIEARGINPIQYPNIYSHPPIPISALSSNAISQLTYLYRSLVDDGYFRLLICSFTSSLARSMHVPFQQIILKY